MAQFQTQDFARLYARVTADLKDHLDREEGSGRLTNKDRLWFEDLIAGFDVEFQRWPTYASGEIFEYLRLFEGRKVGPHLRLAAHVFLHIAYDLPRVIAVTLQKATSVPRDSMRIAYLRPGPVLLKTFLSHARAGDLGFLGGLIGRLEPARAIAFWVLALRSIAWIQAEVIADRNGCPQCERNMEILLLRAGREAVDQRWLFGVSELDNSRLFQVTPIVGGGDFATGTMGALVGSLLAFVGISWYLNLRAERDEAVGQIEVLGSLVYSAMLRSIDQEFRAVNASVQP